MILTSAGPGLVRFFMSQEPLIEDNTHFHNAPISRLLNRYVDGPRENEPNTEIWSVNQFSDAIGLRLIPNAREEIFITPYQACEEVLTLSPLSLSRLLSLDQSS